MPTRVSNRIKQVNDRADRIRGESSEAVRSVTKRPTVEGFGDKRIDSGQTAPLDSLFVLRNEPTGLGPGQVSETERGTNFPDSAEKGDKTPNDDRPFDVFFPQSRRQENTEPAPREDNNTAEPADTRDNRATLMLLALVAGGLAFWQLRS